MRKAVHLATKLGSFDSARESLAATVEVELTTKRIERLAGRIGTERVSRRERDVRAREALPLVKKLAAPQGVKPPEVACVMSDGGRMQRCDLPVDAKTHWCETKVGALLELKAEKHTQDPCPELPDTFRDLAKMGKITREIHRTAAEKAAIRGEVFGRADAEPAEHETPPPDPLAEVREAVVFEPPVVVGRDVAASLVNSTSFGKQLAARAWSPGFAGAPLKAFVGDGLPANWGIWERDFKHLGFVPILDFIHALTYVSAAAMADRSPTEGGAIYLRWITLVWQGQVSQLIAEVAARAAELGPLPADASETDPRQIVAGTLTYLVNQQSRMNYPAYRLQGLPITSSHIESTVKQINRRVKGSEKFWTADRGEAMLQLRAEQLSDTQPLEVHWVRRSQNATGTRTYTNAA
jgi:hypothetical protein